MANLTDTRYKMQGKTVLYVPNEGTRLPIEEAAKSKEFVQRLESKKHFIIMFFLEPLCFVTQGPHTVTTLTNPILQPQYKML